MITKEEIEKLKARITEHGGSSFISREDQKQLCDLSLWALEARSALIKNCWCAEACKVSGGSVTCINCQTLARSPKAEGEK